MIKDGLDTRSVLTAIHLPNRAIVRFPLVGLDRMLKGVDVFNRSPLINKRIFLNFQPNNTKVNHWPGVRSILGELPEEASDEIISGGDIIIAAGMSVNVCHLETFKGVVELKLKSKRKPIFFIAREATDRVLSSRSIDDSLYVKYLAEKGLKYESYHFADKGEVNLSGYGYQPEAVLVWVETSAEALAWLSWINDLADFF